MNIAIASETEEIDGLVPATFKESPFLMIIDADKNQIFHVYGKQDPDNLVFAKKVVEHDCEAVICGPIEKEPFEILVKAGVTRYLGSGHTVQKAYSYMNRYKLELIRDYIGGPGPFGHSHDFSCECGEEEEHELLCEILNVVFHEKSLVWMLVELISSSTPLFFTSPMFIR